MLFCLSGCFSFGPRPLLPENKAPVIDATNFENGETITIGSTGVRVFVIAHDPEESELSYTWALSSDGYLGNAQAIPDGSQVELLQNPQLSGQDLTLTIKDDENALVQRSWPLVVP